MADQENSLVRPEWAQHVADHLDRWHPEPLPRAWRVTPIQEAVRHANSRKWEGLCWAYRVLRGTDGERADNIKRFCYASWNKPPMAKYVAREYAKQLRHE
jgi:hypothetical protein